MTDLVRILEALLFASEGPLTLAQVQELYPELEEQAIEDALAELKRFYDTTERAFSLTPIAGGYQLLTRSDVAPEVERFLVGRRRQRLSRAALEALAVVAYRQPVTRGEVESIRGVDCGGVFRTLLERQLIGIKGRSPAVGHPLLYVTTERFLEHFGLMDLSELPKLTEFEALISREEARDELARAGVIQSPRSDGVDDPAQTDPEADPSEGAAGETASDDGEGACGWDGESQRMDRDVPLQELVDPAQDGPAELTPIERDEVPQ